MDVVLAHGLGRSRLSMLLLGQRLKRAGHTPHYFSYSSLTESYASIVARMVALLRQFEVSQAHADREAIGLIGHSFGGLLFRQALSQVPGLGVSHLIMLGTPNRPPRLAPQVYLRSPLKFLRNELGQLLADRNWYRSLPGIAVPYTLVSGTKGWRGALSPFKFDPNDAIVSVSETLLSDQDRPVLVPGIHTFLMNKRVVFELIVKKLASKN